ncbi:MAG: N-acetylmuramoyl-L-alanine amidase [Acidobacteriota bacterium]
MSSSDDSSHLRKQLLRQAVADNVATRDGRPTAARPRRAATAATPRRRAALLGSLIVGVLALGAYAAWRPEPTAPDAASAAGTSSVDSASADAVENPATSTQPNSPLALGDDPVAGLVFDAPRPIDPGVFSLAVERIVLDPGHGGRDSGTVGSGLEEKEITLDIALRLRDRLVADGFEVHLTREDDRALSLRERAETANELRADLFVSIHVNWIPGVSTRGVETYFLGSTDDPELNKLARFENRDSGFNLADMRSLLERLYTDVRQNASQDLASQVQRSLFLSLARENPALVDRGVKSAPFVVLVATQMPAILAEVSCLSNEEEAELLARPLYRDHIADALARGIRKYADQVHPTESKGIDA